MKNLIKIAEVYVKSLSDYREARDDYQRFIKNKARLMKKFSNEYLQAREQNLQDRINISYNQWKGNQQIIELSVSAQTYHYLYEHAENLWRCFYKRRD